MVTYWHKCKMYWNGIACCITCHHSLNISATSRVSGMWRSQIKLKCLCHLTIVFTMVLDAFSPAGAECNFSLYHCALTGEQLWTIISLFSNKLCWRWAVTSGTEADPCQCYILFCQLANCLGNVKVEYWSNPVCKFGLFSWARLWDLILWNC